MSPRADVPGLVAELLESYHSDPRLQYLNRHYLPSREGILEVLRLCLELLYPGYHGRKDLTDENVGYHVGEIVTLLREKLEIQIERCLCDDRERCENRDEGPSACRGRARLLTACFLASLPRIRRVLLEDAQAARDGDPAASSLDEVVLAYPGFLAITVHRLAHELHVLGVPLMPRILSEWAHSRTGADIHPAARIGPGFFLDHATGAVIGATAELGQRVRLYQGVTLGALSLPRDEDGSMVRDRKRHPTVEDEVTIYANATVLGGETVVGRGSVVGGQVFLTRSVPPDHRVSVEPPRLRVRGGTPTPPLEPDFQI